MLYEQIPTSTATPLMWLINQAQSTWHILEIGEGTLAAALQGQVASVGHLDITNIAAQYAETSTSFNLPFAEQTFDVIVCQDVVRFLDDGLPLLVACAKLLKPAGLLVIDEISAPDDPRAARYIDAFERLGDPRHRRTYAEFEWTGLLLDASLSLDNIAAYSEHVALLDWAQALARPAGVIDRLHILLAQAPRAASAWLQPQYANSPAAYFTRHRLQITAKKEA